MGDMTVRQLGRAVGRYTPFIGTVLVILLLAAVLPGQRTADEPTDRFVDPTADQPATSGTSSTAPDGEPNDPGEPLEEANASAPEPQGSAPTERSDEPTGGAAAAAGPAQGSGSDPLDAPDCDRETGRLKVPSATGVGSQWAPNCVPMWPEDSDNGAETDQGVTEDTITIAIYMGQDDTTVEAAFADTGYEAPSEEERKENRNKIIEAFEGHYETYGRQVEWVEVHASGPPWDDQAARSDAIQVAEEIGAFASLSSPAMHVGGGFAYVEELEARGVVCLVCTNKLPHWEYDSGYLWNYNTSGTGSRTFLADVLGRTLGGGPAAYAGDPLLQQENRRFGLIQYDTEDGLYAYSEDWLNKELGRYGLGISLAISYELDPTRTQEQARTIITRMKEAGITTILVPVDPVSLRFFTEEATRQQYFPEWILATGGGTDFTLFARTYDQVQWENAFGITNLPARLDPDAQDMYTNIVWWHHGEDLESYPDFLELALLFTGVHLAGPELTPGTFAEGLRSLQSSSGYITRIGQSFGSGVWPWDEYNANDDHALLWWDPAATGTDEAGAYGRGMYRFENEGERYLPGESPTEDEVSWFDPDNAPTLYEELPERDRLPRYEPREPMRRP